MIKENIFTFGQCKRCGRIKPLCEGMCYECVSKEKMLELPASFKEIFNVKN